MGCQRDHAKGWAPWKGRTSFRTAAGPTLPPKRQSNSSTGGVQEPIAEILAEARCRGHRLLLPGVGRALRSISRSRHRHCGAQWKDSEGRFRRYSRWLLFRPRPRGRDRHGDPVSTRHAREGVRGKSSRGRRNLTRHDGGTGFQSGTGCLSRLRDRVQMAILRHGVGTGTMKRHSSILGLTSPSAKE